MKLTVPICLLTLTAGLALAQPSGTLEHIRVHGEALEGNLIGDPTTRDIEIYLPPGYNDDTSKRYPVVYLLHGYGGEAATWIRERANLPGSADRDIAAGKIKPMILVVPDAYNKYGGSMYSASIGTGDWERYITHDLVNYIDSHYRTLAMRESRGLGGHSMGGYGAWRIGMKYPQMFAALYPMSACCLMNSPRPRPADAPEPPQREMRRNDRGVVDVQSGEAAAWSPNPQNPPLFFDRPVVDNALRPEIAAKWIANSPLAMIDQYYYNLIQYDAIATEVGLDDTLLNSVRQMEKSLERLGIEHSYAEYDGDHTNHVPERIEENVLPFFSQHLKFQE